MALATAGCATTGQRLERAGHELGIAAAGLQLPAWPIHCRQPVPHAATAAGDDAVSVLRLERQQLEFANRRAANCGAYYDTLRHGLTGE